MAICVVLLTSAPPAEASWSVEVDAGMPAAIGEGVPAMPRLAVVCHRFDGLLVTTDLGPDAASALAITFDFDVVRLVVPFRRIFDDVPLHYADPDAVRTLTQMLGGRSSRVRVAVDGVDAGVMALRGSTAAIGDLSEDCPIGGPPGERTLARLERMADSISPTAGIDRENIARLIAHGRRMGAPDDALRKIKPPDAVRERIAAIAAACPGEATIRNAAVASADFTGDGEMDWLVSPYGVTCPGARPFCEGPACEVMLVATRPDGPPIVQPISLGGSYAFDARGLVAPCGPPGEWFRVEWDGAELAVTLCPGGAQAAR